MIPWKVLDTAKVPGGGELRLKQRGTEFSIMLGTNELMNSRLFGSEEALSTLAIERLPVGAKPRILIGGLGMGFTLRAALAVTGPKAEITVAELVPAVIAWARGPMAEVIAGKLEDPRVTLYQGDVGQRIRESRGDWDAILLDVDNGPEGLSRSRNNSLYDSTGIAQAYMALHPEGILGVWSSAPDKGFSRSLSRSGFTVEEKSVPARGFGHTGPRHTIWLAKRPASVEFNTSRRDSGRKRASRA